MKKAIVIIVAAMGFSFHGMSQEKYVVSAATALKSNNIDEAKENIDKAMANADTKDKPKTLFVKGEVYINMQALAKYKASSPYREGAQALLRLMEVKPDYEKETVYGLLMAAMYCYYNDGVNEYNDKKYSEAAADMKSAVKIHAIDPGKQITDQIPEITKKKIDTAVAEADQIIAYCAYYGGQYQEAIPLLVKVKNNPVTKTASAYACLIDAYNHEKNSADAAVMIKEGRAIFPEDPTIRNYELNYYISSGKDDEIIKKLEDASAKDPKNSDILFNIATTYLKMARPEKGPKPANVTEFYGKAEDAFTRALAINPHNELYNYNYGSMYYNEGIDINDQMNAITGTSDADQKKYDELKGKRDALFVKSTPYFEEAYSSYSTKESRLQDEDKDTYKATVRVLKELYARQGKMDKSAEMKKKLETM